MTNITVTDKPVVMLFSATSWCIPCQRLEPHWNSLTKLENMRNDFNFIHVDMGADPSDLSTHWATEKYAILSVPTIKLFTLTGDVIDIKSRTLVPLIKEIRSYG